MENQKSLEELLKNGNAQEWRNASTQPVSRYEGEEELPREEFRPDLPNASYSHYLGAIEKVEKEFCLVSGKSSMILTTMKEINFYVNCVVLSANEKHGYLQMSDLEHSKDPTDLYRKLFAVRALARAGYIEEEIAEEAVTKFKMKFLNQYMWILAEEEYNADEGT